MTKCNKERRGVIEAQAARRGFSGFARSGGITVGLGAQATAREPRHGPPLGMLVNEAVRANPTCSS